ncbi:Protein of uncharacterised function (DUF1656) [Serratia grimesii]|jgi:hypothetical protein|uniref:DUF1656 domain-containing protein n=1 Tax=Serratia grimesii TaxID=82995 RepID=UPI0021C4FF53|nr:DUF1656 domain-containing protein [Serratia grimesii]CAI2790394.1 Protein of uncharacterised function (DUF1656) [Serratia grimesii]
MIGEINIDGVFISPLLLCLVCAFFLRMVLSWMLSIAGVYRLVAQRPLFDTALFLILAGLFFYGLKLLTTP